MKWFYSTENSKWVEGSNTIDNMKEVDTSLKISGETDQTMAGFGGCFNELGAIALEKLSKETQDEVMDLLFDTEQDGLRFNFCRMPIGASDYAAKWYSHNEVEGDFEMKHHSIERDHKYLLPYIKESYKRNPDIKMFASPWSPPTWMKTPQAYNYGTMVMTEENLKAYALYFSKFVKAYEAEGIHIDQIHVQNEPHSSQKFPSCIWTGEEFATFIGKYLGPEFEEKGVDSEIWLGTLNGPEVDHRKHITTYHQYANLVLHDSDAYKYIKGVSYQWAGKYAMQVTRQSWPEMNLIQSENECGNGDNSWEYARYVYDLFQHYLSNGAYAYVYWNMVLENEGESTWGWKQNSLVVVEGDAYSLAHEYYVMKHFSRYVEAGAKRLKLSGPFTSNSVAFKNPDGSVVVTVFNPFDREMNFELTLEGKKHGFRLEKDSMNTFVL